MSFETAALLSDAPPAHASDPATALIGVLNKHWQQHHDETFAGLGDWQDLFDKILEVCKQAQGALQDDPIMVNVSSPIYVLGDIHGSLRDLHLYVQQLLWQHPCLPY